MADPTVSLIVATLNRVAELERLLASLDGQTFADFEVVIVDQNPDDRLRSTLAQHPDLSLVHLRCPPGASRARNLGLRAAKGEIIAFPDDDCWYPGQLLSSVVEWLHAHPEFDGLFTGVRTADNRLLAPKFPPRPGPCTKKSVLRCAMAVNAFLRATVTKAVGFFREDIGPGTSSPYQSGEDLDYILRPLETGLRVWYEPGLTVHHPDLKARERLRRTTYSYALGVGYVWRIHGFSWWWCLGNVVVRSLGGAAVNLCRGDVGGGYLYLLRAAGQFRGYAFTSGDCAGSPHNVSR